MCFQTIRLSSEVTWGVDIEKQFRNKHVKRIARAYGSPEYLRSTTGIDIGAIKDGKLTAIYASFYSPPQGR